MAQKREEGCCGSQRNRARGKGRMTSVNDEISGEASCPPTSPTKSCAEVPEKVPVRLSSGSLDALSWLCGSPGLPHKPHVESTYKGFFHYTQLQENTSECELR